MSDAPSFVRPQPGMTVISHDATEVGTIKEVRAKDFLLDRSMRRDVYVPFRVIAAVTGSRVQLTVTTDEINAADWEKPGLVGSMDDADSLAPPDARVVGTGDPDERNGWSPSSDSYTLGPIDTTDQRLATEGIDDGRPPRGAEPPTADEVIRRQSGADERPR